MNKRSIKSFLATLAVLLGMGALCAACYFNRGFVEWFAIPLFFSAIVATIAYNAYRVFYDFVFKAD